MNADAERSMVGNPRVFKTAAAAVAAALVGVMTLVGWASGAANLTAVIVGLTPMQANTAVCIIALGVAVASIALWPTKPTRHIVRVLAVAVAAVGLATLFEYVFGRDLGIDRVLFHAATSAAPHGRMGSNTAIALALLGSAIVLITDEAEPPIRWAQLLTLGAAVIAFTSLLGYIYTATFLYQVRAATPMAVNTATALLLLSGSIVWARPGKGFVGFIHAADNAGLILRELIPPAVIAPVLLGWVQLLGQRAGYYGTTYGVSLLVLAMIAVFVTLIVANSQSIRALDAIRKRSRDDVEAAFAMIEKRVVDRTRELDAAMTRLADSERRLELATEGSNSGILDHDVVRGEMTCSRRWNEMLGRRADDPITPAAFMALIHPDDREAALRALVDHYKGVGPYSSDLRMRHADGSYRWMLSRGRALRDESGRAVRMIGSQTDITEIKELQEALRNASIRDGITGLYNRVHFVERLTAAARVAMRHQLPLSLCMCDVDRFKSINDTYGHPVGDAVIKSVGDAIAAEIRAGDVCARYGGDEFCIMFEATASDQAIACVERIKTRVENTPFFATDRRRFAVSVSFGISDLAGRSVPELFEAADQALYLAKEHGRSRIVVHGPATVQRGGATA